MIDEFEINKVFDDEIKLQTRHKEEYTVQILNRVRAVLLSLAREETEEDLAVTAERAAVYNPLNHTLPYEPRDMGDDFRGEGE